MYVFNIKSDVPNNKASFPATKQLSISCLAAVRKPNFKGLKLYFLNPIWTGLFSNLKRLWGHFAPPPPPS